MRHKAERLCRSVASLCATWGEGCQCCEPLQNPSKKIKVYDGMGF